MIAQEHNPSLILFPLGRIICLIPFIPATLEGRDLFKSPLDKFLCHPGTGRLILSGSVKNNGFFLGILFGPGFHIARIFPNRPFDLLQTHFPVP